MDQEDKLIEIMKGKDDKIIAIYTPVRPNIVSLTQIHLQIVIIENFERKSNHKNLYHGSFELLYYCDSNSSTTFIFI